MLLHAENVYTEERETEHALADGSILFVTIVDRYRDDPGDSVTSPSTTCMGSRVTDVVRLDVDGDNLPVDDDHFALAVREYEW